MANTKVGPISFILGSFSNDEGEGNENVKNAIVYKEKQQLCTRITFFCTFLSGHYTTTA